MSDAPTDAAADPSTEPEQIDDLATADAPELHGCPVTESCGQTVVHPTPERYLDVVKALTDDGYAMVVDLTGVDYLEFMGRSLPDGIDPQRFEVVVNMLDLGNRRRVRVRVQVSADEPRLPSLFDVHPGTEAMEREVFDMFGVEFDDHPDLTRILMPEDWVGHPLRKDYEVGKIPVQFKGAHA